MGAHYTRQSMPRPTWSAPLAGERGNREPDLQNIEGLAAKRLMPEGENAMETNKRTWRNW
jgi:hypothetical protein